MSEIFDFTTFPTLTSERLVLRAPEPDDAADLFGWRSDPVVQRSNSAPLRYQVEAQTIADNHESVRLLERLGFRPRRAAPFVLPGGRRGVSRRGDLRPAPT